MSRKPSLFDLDPDEIFLDSSNIPKFDNQQFEGRFEKPIKRGALIFVGFIFGCLFLGYVGRAFYLQVISGAVYAERSRVNHVRQEPIFSNRGIVYDRNKTVLISNELVEGDEHAPPERVYYDRPGFSHILGYVSYPKRDSSGFFWQNDYIGKDGIEKTYDSYLKGVSGRRLIETNASGGIVSENTVTYPRDGETLTLSIDAGVQEELYRDIRALAERARFSGGAGVIMNVNTGEILALTSFPEYDNSFKSYKIKKVDPFADKSKPFINRAIAGLYTPGSVVKPFFALAALEENVITPEKQILSTGQISIPNPFKKGEETIFKDWKAHGLVNMRQAIAVSSDVYFYEIGGGYKDQKGLGIKRLEQYSTMFGFGQRTGVDLPGESSGTIPGEEWKAKMFDGEQWLVGDTYHTAIGQYGFQMTPIELVRAVAAIANGGKLLTPRVNLSAPDTGEKPVVLTFKENNLKVVREGMRKAVTEGTVQGLSIPGFRVAAKSGTAQVGARKQYVNSWITGYFPYDEPKYAFAVVLEQGSPENTEGAQFAVQPLLWYLIKEKREYTGQPMIATTTSATSTSKTQ